MPVIIDGDGNCHVYVDAAADLDGALDIVVNAKTQRPSVCNAAESLRGARGGRRRLPARGRRRAASSRASSSSATPAPAPACPTMGEATDDDFAPRVPRAQDERRGGAVARRRHRPRQPVRLRPHRGDPHRATSPPPRRFTDEVDAGTVVVNASTRFTDGEEFGFGAEIGICTQKLHARGPMGLRELTTYKYVVWGDGQIRD